MGHIERGEKNLSFSTLLRLADALGIGLPELLSDRRASKVAVKGAGRGMASRSMRPRPNPEDLSALIRELENQREILVKSADCLGDAAKVLRTYKRKPGGR